MADAKDHTKDLPQNGVGQNSMKKLGQFYLTIYSRGIERFSILQVYLDWWDLQVVGKVNAKKS